MFKTIIYLPSQHMFPEVCVGNVFKDGGDVAWVVNVPDNNFRLLRQRKKA